MWEEDVVKNGEANGSTNVPDGESDGSDSTDQVGRTDDLGDQRAGDNDSTNTNTRQRNDGVDGRVDVVCTGNGHGPDKAGHPDAPEDHEKSSPTLGNKDKAKIHHGATNNAKSNGKCANSNLERVVAIDVIDLCGPEKKHDEEIATAEEGHEQDENHGALVARKNPGRDHGVFRKHDLVDEEGYE